MSNARKFSDQESVFAKWPGSALYYKANVVSYVGHGKYNVKFQDDEDTTTLATKDIQKESFMTRARSPGRSPGRSRSRSKSPSRRRSRSPARKVASPKIKASTSPVATKPRSPARTSKKKTETKEVKELKGSTKLEVRRIPSERSAVVQPAMKIMEEQETSDVEEVKSSVEFQGSSVTRSGATSVREQSSTVTRRTTRSVTRMNQKETSKEQPETSPLKCCMVKSKILCGLCCVGSLLMNIIMMVLPLFFIYGIYLSCRTSKSCTFLKLPSIPACEKFFNWKSTSYVFGWFLFQLILSSLPLGKRVDGPILPNSKREPHILNGFASLVISMAAALILNRYGKLPVKYITVNYLSLITAAFIYTFVISIATFLLSRKAGSKEPSGGFLNDFVVGRTISPVVCSCINLKTYAFKTGFISWALLNLVYFLKVYDTGKLRSYTSLVTLEAFMLVYILDAMFFEESLYYTASLTTYRIGFMMYLSVFVLFPFFCVLQVRYLAIVPLTLNWYCYVAPTLLQMIGYYIYRTSVLQKFLFRKDFNTAKNKGARFIPTANGKNLLIDGWWGRLRHPNYTGDFMMMVSWGILCGFHHLLPWLWPIILVPNLVGMAHSDGKECEKKYGPNWREYEKLVKYKLIPYIY